MPINISFVVGGGGPGKLEHRVVSATDTEVKITLTTNASVIQVQNVGSKVAYIGGTGVTTDSFWAYITPRQNYNFGLVGSGFNFFVICKSGETTTIGVGEDA